MRTAFPLLGLVTLLAACASDKPPAAPLARADQAIQSAANVGAAQAAPLELRIAQEKLGAAQATDDAVKSQRLADEAIASAELAQAKAQAARAQASLQDLNQSASERYPAAGGPSSSH